MHSESTPGDSATTWNSTARSIASLVLFIHLFCLAVALTANQAPSPLQERLLFVFRPYTQLLNFDVSFVRFDLTQETADDADQRIEYLPEGRAVTDADAWVLLSGGIRGSDRQHRYQRLATLMSFFRAREDDSTTAVLASAVATHLYQQRHGTHRPNPRASAFAPVARPGARRRRQPAQSLQPRVFPRCLSSAGD